MRPFFTFGDSHRMDDLLNKDNIVASFPTRDETRLEGMNEVIKVRFYPLNKDFCDSFVKSVAKADRAELVNSFWFVDLCHKADKG